MNSLSGCRGTCVRNISPQSKDIRTASDASSHQESPSAAPPLPGQRDEKVNTDCKQNGEYHASKSFCGILRSTRSPPSVPSTTPRTAGRIAGLPRGPHRANGTEDVVLIDDQARRQKTVGEGLQVAGTHSVLDEAERSSLVDSDEVVVDFQKTSFRIANVVLSEIRAKRSR